MSRATIYRKIHEYGIVPRQLTAGVGVLLTHTEKQLAAEPGYAGVIGMRPVSGARTLPAKEQP